jgi:hypothetical protein
MENTIFLFLLTVLSGCSDDAFIFAEGETGTYYIPVHYQNCYFSNNVVMHRGDDSIVADSGEVISIQNANLFWHSYSDAGQLFIVDIDTLGVERVDTTYILHDSESDSRFWTDTVFYNYYHTGVCTVNVTW